MHCLFVADIVVIYFSFIFSNFNSQENPIRKFLKLKNVPDFEIKA